MDENKTPLAVDLPEGLQRQFRELERQLWRVETALAACVGIGALLLSYLLLFLSDRLWETPVWLRVVLTGAGVLVFLATAAVWFQRWVLTKHTVESLAALVQRRYRRLGDKLLGIVELAHEHRRPENFSPTLYRAAIEQVATEAAKLDFPEAVNRRPMRRFGTVMAVLGATAAAGAVFVPQATRNAFLRWLQPVSDTPRHTLVALEGLPGEQVVPHGEPFSISFAVKYRSAWQPARAVGQVGAQPRATAVARDGRVTFEIPGQTTEGRLRIKVGDARAVVAIKPLHRPSLRDMTATVELPSYLQYPPATESVKKGSLALLEGGKVSLEGLATRALSSADMAAGEAERSAVVVRAETFSTNSLDLRGVERVFFRWQDQFGLTSAVPWQLSIQPVKDNAPLPEIVDQPREISVLETEILSLKGRGTDDYGIRDLGLVLDLVAGPTATNDTARFDIKADPRDPKEKRVEEIFQISPALWQLPADSILEVRAYTSDYYPDRLSVNSGVYQIYVVGNTRHAEMVRQNLDAVLARLEEVSRLEEKLTAETAAAIDAAKLDDPKLAEKLAQLTEEQARNAARLDDLAREGMKLLRDALRNPTFSEQSIGEWAERFQDMKSLSQEKMQGAASSLKSSQKNRDARLDELAKALKQEQEALDGLQQLQKSVNEGLDQLQAVTLADRLRGLGKKQTEIEGKVQRNVAEIIGMLPEELPERFKLENKSFADDQAAAQAEAVSLQEEISRFFERSRKPNYGEVSRDMKEARTADEMEKVRALIQDNISMGAMQNLAAWSKRFGDWAAKLEPPKAAAAAGGGEGNSSGDQKEPLNVLKQLVAMLRLREKEVIVREQTKLVEKEKENAQRYADNTKLLAEQEGKGLEELNRIGSELPVPALQQIFSEIRQSMTGVHELLSKPQTDEETVKAETGSINLLTDAINFINELAQRPSGEQQQSQAQESAFLMQMMRQEGQEGMPSNPGSNPGINMSGGTTSRVPGALSANNDGQDESRAINRAGGTTENLPAEFRDALQIYFNEIDRNTAN